MLCKIIVLLLILDYSCSIQHVTLVCIFTVCFLFITSKICISVNKYFNNILVFISRIIFCLNLNFYRFILKHFRNFKLLKQFTKMLSNRHTSLDVIKKKCQNTLRFALLSSGVYPCCLFCHRV